ncbi:hypothetical protein DENSPDRAFT_164322 [Dentipellis sp. KUC8613]|nr:hypothetical protein DENSPDRAFT_164322 [Dentipellis sp. KUC8613]
MSKHSPNSPDAGVLNSAHDSSPAVSASHQPAKKRRAARTASQERRDIARVLEEVAAFAEANAPAEEERRTLQREWGCYPWQARPRTRREELQKFPALCNDFESFEKQMARVDRRAKEPDGLLYQIWDFMNERKRALERQEEEAERQQNDESISHFRQGIKELYQMGEEIQQRTRANNEYCQRVLTEVQRTQEFVDRTDNLASEVREYGMSRASPRQRIYHPGGAGRNTH